MASLYTTLLQDMACIGETSVRALEPLLQSMVIACLRSELALQFVFSSELALQIVFYPQ